MFRYNSKSSFLLYAVRIFSVVLQKTHRLDFKSWYVSIALVMQEALVFLPQGKKKIKIWGTRNWCPARVNLLQIHNSPLTTFLCTVQITWNSHQGLINHNFSSVHYHTFITLWGSRKKFVYNSLYNNPCGCCKWSSIILKASSFF